MRSGSCIGAYSNGSTKQTENNIQIDMDEYSNSMITESLDCISVCTLCELFSRSAVPLS